MEKTTIAESCELHARIGWQGLTKNEYLDQGDYYLVTGVDFEKGHINFSGCHYVTKDRFDQDSHIQLRINDVLVTKDGTIGKVAIIDTPIDKPATLNSGVFVVRPKDPERLLPKYLMIVLLSNHFNQFIERIKVGCTIAHLNQEKFLGYSFPLPSVKKQEQIIQVFETLFSLLNLRKEELVQLDDLIRARFVEMFGDFKLNPMGWPIVSFDDIAIIDGNMTTDYERYANYPHIGIDSIEKDTGLLKGYRTVAEDGVISGKYVFTPKHIIYSKIRPNLNKVALPSFNGLCSADAYPILPMAGKCNRVFLAYNMRSPYFLDYILQFCNRTNLPKVNRKEIAGFKTPLPPIELQNEFSEFVAQVGKSKSVVQEALDEAQTLFDSLMQQYFD